MKPASRKPARQASQPRSASQAIRQQLDREAVRQWQEREPRFSLSIEDGRQLDRGYENFEQAYLPVALANSLRIVRRVGRPAYVSVH